MNAKMTHPSDEVCLRILEAVAQHFTWFGKADVAQGYGMSAANFSRSSTKIAPTTEVTMESAALVVSRHQARLSVLS